LENFNGPVRLMVGCGKGIIRVFYYNPFASNIYNPFSSNITSFWHSNPFSSNYIPIDTVIKAMIVTAWKHGVMKYDKFHFYKSFFIWGIAVEYVV